MGNSNSAEEAPVVNPQVPFNPAQYAYTQDPHQLNSNQQQLLQRLMASGVRPDMAFRPFQLPRVPNEPPLKAVQQKTIRLKNEVNLIKNTFTAVNRDGRYGVSFDFDASVPCCVRVYFMATELIDHHNATVRFDQQVYAQPGKYYTYPAGPGQHFTQPKEDYLDVSQLSAAQLSYSSSTRFFPIVVSLEKRDAVNLSLGSEAVVIPAGPHVTSRFSSPSSPSISSQPCPSADAAHSSSLSSSSPFVSTPVSSSVKPSNVSHHDSSSPQQEKKVSSQFTFATFAPRSDGSLDAKVLKQKIQVDGFSYELQEIYGLGSVQDDGNKECVACLTNPRSRTLLPCRHMCLCAECAERVQQTTNRCPICRQYVASLMEINIFK